MFNKFESKTERFNTNIKKISNLASNNKIYPFFKNDNKNINNVVIIFNHNPNITRGENIHKKNNDCTITKT